MSHWTAYVAASFALAIAIRIDARTFGPYFSISNLISGLEGLDAPYWLEEKELRKAFLRRLVWPLLTGFALAWLGAGALDAALVTALGGALLLWPMVFHGLPVAIPRGTWHLPTLYGLFLMTYGLLGSAGQLSRDVVTPAGDSFAQWAASSAASAVVAASAGLICSALYARLWRTIRAMWEQNISIHDPEAHA